MKTLWDFIVKHELAETKNLKIDAEHALFT